MFDKSVVVIVALCGMAGGRQFRCPGRVFLAPVLKNNHIEQRIRASYAARIDLSLLSRDGS